MKTKYFFLVLFTLLYIHSFSQIKIGVRAGISSSSIKSKDLVTDTFSLRSLSDAVVGFHFGVMAQAKILGAYFQPELLFSSTGGKIKLSDVNGSRILDQKFSRIDIPLIFGKAFGPARIGIGPVASFIINSNSELTDIEGYDDKFKSATFGYQIDLGLDFWKLALDLKYEGNLSKLGNSVKLFNNSFSFDQRGRQFIFSVGLFF